MRFVVTMSLAALFFFIVVIAALVFAAMTHVALWISLLYCFFAGIVSVFIALVLVS